MGCMLWTRLKMMVLSTSIRLCMDSTLWMRRKKRIFPIILQDGKALEISQAYLRRYSKSGLILPVVKRNRLQSIRV